MAGIQYTNGTLSYVTVDCYNIKRVAYDAMWKFQ